MTIFYLSQPHRIHRALTIAAASRFFTEHAPSITTDDMREALPDLIDMPEISLHSFPSHCLKVECTGQQLALIYYHAISS